MPDEPTDAGDESGIPADLVELYEILEFADADAVAAAGEDPS